MELAPDRYATIRNVYLHYREIQVATLGNNTGKIRKRFCTTSMPQVTPIDPGDLQLARGRISRWKAHG
jgi:hypothetical protein